MIMRFNRLFIGSGIPTFMNSLEKFAISVVLIASSSAQAFQHYPEKVREWLSCHRFNRLFIGSGIPTKENSQIIARDKSRIILIASSSAQAFQQSSGNCAKDRTS
jgi:hypothetical protein